ncbi:hypothetical protein EDF46_2949 [Frondihabitans sp. PhB188]|uniref:HAD family hydrolase n=1 Tax=Frondihabitans sp. PhB188 TaxID=2485200 RepID=UPI000FBC43AD|nr:HAD family hydrolase [Frondihabitans sp. PhB188]ROQ37493.1 hypothetical protein EDF46_2949 [Frondihabitans sp. PhB188]
MTTLYVCDLDGTLLGPEASPSAFTVDTVNGLVAHGVHVAVATARSAVSLRRVVGDLDLRGPACVYGGAFVVDLSTGETLVQRVLDTAVVDGILDVFARTGTSPLVYSLDPAAEASEETVAGAGEHADTVGWVRGHEGPGIAWYLGDRGDDPRFRPVDSPADLTREGTFSIVALAPESDLEPVRRTIEREFAGHVTATLQEETYLPGIYWLELAAPGADKGHGVLELKSLLGADRVVVFGDNRNDLAMFRVADASYAVANASAEVREAATGVIGSNADDGVAHWLAAHARVPARR